jgi:hypothetical protein
VNHKYISASVIKKEEDHCLPLFNSVVRELFVRLGELCWTLGAADDRLLFTEGLAGCCRVLRLLGIETEFLSGAEEFR